MQTDKIKISKIRPNTGQIDGLPQNPRLLRDDRFHKLVKSIEDDPEMLDLRELIVVPKDGIYVVIAGNMRLRAMQELKMKEAPCKVLPADTSIEKLRAYTIKDNVPFGEHDWEMLANEWDAVELADWGLDAPYIGHEVNVMDENELDLSEEFDPIGTSKGLQRVVFVFDSQEHATSFLAKDKSWKVEKFNNGWRVNLSSQSM